MKQSAYRGLARASALAVTLLLSFISAPGATPAAQHTSSSTSSSTPSSTPAFEITPQQSISRLAQSASDNASQSANHSCQDLNHCMEQIEAQARTIEKEIEAKLPELERAAKEVEMSSPEMSKLQSLSAKFQGEQDELAARAEELAQQLQEQVQKDVQENADRVVAMSPGVFVSSSDDGGWLGVEIGEVSAEKAKNLRLSSVRGVIVDDVEPDSPAAKAGVKENDVITQYDGKPVEGTVQFRRLVRETPPGRTITLAISRGGATQNISVELGDRSAYFEKKMKGKMRDFGQAYSFSLPNFNVELPEMPETIDARTPLLGINAEDLTGQLGSYFGAPDNAGILVREVRPGTPAEKAGLKAGDVIVKLEGKQVRTLADLRSRLRDMSDQPSVAMSVLRKGSEVTVTVPIEKPRPMEQMHSVHRAQL